MRSLGIVLASLLLATSVVATLQAADRGAQDADRSMIALPAVGSNPLDRWESMDVRLMTWNVQGNFINDPSRDAAFARVISAADPDVIVFEEISSNAVESQIPAWLNSTLGGSWTILGGIPTGIRTVVATRFSLTMQATDTTPPSSTRGVTMALVDLPDVDYTHDLYVMGVHLKCCSGSENDAKRQRSADAIASWMGDARLPGDQIDLPADTPMIAVGDFNLVGSIQQELTLVTGDIQDEATFGPDIKGDWDVTNLVDLTPVDPVTLNTNTWPSTSSPSSRLDRYFFTDSVVTVGNTYILNTLTMSSADLNANGLNSTDTQQSSTSDHLPVIMDVRVGVKFLDCNNNSIADSIDISSGTSQDCNVNAIPDECDIADGTSLDDDFDGIPDECQVLATLVINELLADPAGSQPGDLEGDANGDGVRDTFDDEFLELINTSGGTVNIAGWTITDGTSGGAQDQVRHIFPAGTVLEDGCGVVVFGGGNPTGQFGDMMVQTASTGQLSLRNSNDFIWIHDSIGNEVAMMSHTGAGSNTSLVLDVDISGTEYINHNSHPDSGGALFSPGYTTPGDVFTGCGAVAATGACCTGDGSCITTTADACVNDGGTYLGDAVPCLPDSCGLSCLADCSDENGVVDVVDLLDMLSQFGTNGTCDMAPDGGDNVVDVVDLLFLLSQWGGCP